MIPPWKHKKIILSPLFMLALLGKNEIMIFSLMTFCTNTLPALMSNEVNTVALEKNTTIMLTLVIKIFREALECSTRDGWTVQGHLSPYTEIGKILLKYQNSIPPTTTPPSLPTQTPTTILKVPNPTRLTVILGSYVYRYVSCFRLHGVQSLMILLGNQDQTRSKTGSKHLSTSLSNNIILPGQFIGISCSKIFKSSPMNGQYPMHRSKKVSAQDLSTYVRSVSSDKFHSSFVIQFEQ